MRGGFGGDQQAVGLCGPDQLDGPASADVLDVEARGLAVAEGVQRFGDGGGLGVRAIPQPLGLGVDEDGQPGVGGRPEGGAERKPVHRMPSIVGERHRSGRLQRGGIGEPFAFKAGRDRSYETDADR